MRDFAARHIPRSAWIETLAVGLVATASAIFYSAAAGQVTQPGFPLDDSWIHMQFARNLASGEGFSFNPGIASSGSTAPLWTLLLAACAFLRLDLVVAAKVIGTILTIVAGVASARVVRRLTGSSFGAMTAGLAVALSPRLTWGSVSGMEVPLYCALTALTVLAYLRGLESGKSVLWAVLAGLIGTARPEAFVFAPILAAHWFWSHRAAGAGAAFRAVLAPSAAVTGVLGAYLLFNYLAGGTALPATYYAKASGRGLLTALSQLNSDAIVQSGIADPLQFLNTLLQWAQQQSPFLTLAVLVGVLVATGVLPLTGANPRGGIVIVLMLLIAPMARGALVPLPRMLMHDGRYVTHLLVLYFILGSIGLAYVWVQTKRHWAVAAFAGLTLIRLGAQDVKFATQYAAQVKNINDLHVATAAWLRDHTSPEAVIATNDVGAIAYFGHRMLIDTEGLMTPAIVPYKRRNDLAGFLTEAKPDLVIVFPGWYPELAGRSDLLQEVARVTAVPRVIAWGESLVIYRTPWTRAGVVRIAR